MNDAANSCPDACSHAEQKTPWWRNFEGKKEPEIVFTEKALQEYLDEAAAK